MQSRAGNNNLNSYGLIFKSEFPLILPSAQTVSLTSGFRITIEVEIADKDCYPHVNVDQQLSQNLVLRNGYHR